LFTTSQAGTEELIDSLQNQLRSTGSDTNKVKIYVNLSSVIRKQNLQSSHVYAKEALKLAQNLHFQPGIANAFLLIGYVYDEKGNYETALEYYQQSLDILEELKDRPGIARLCNNIGLTYVKRGQIELGLEYYFRSLRIKEDTGDKKGIARSLNNIGVVYRKQGNFEKALKYYEEAAVILEEINDRKGVARSLNNIGNVYYMEEDFDKAIEYQLKALAIREDLKDPIGIARSLTNIAGVYYKKENFSKALEYQFQALKIFENMSSKEGIIYSYNNIGSLYSKAGNYQLALVYSNKSLRLAEEIGSKEDIKLAFLSLSETYTELGDFKKAYEFHEQYSMISDTLLNQENQSNIAEMEAKYESDSKQREIDHRLNTKAKDLMQFERDKTMLYSISGGGILFVILAIFIFLGNRQKQKANQLLRNQNNAISDQKNIIEEKTTDILDSLQYARGIQKAMLPTPKKLSLLNDHFIFYLPRDIVSGDFYWLAEKGNTVLFAAVDCTGHGVPGAFMSIVGHNHLTQAVNQKGLSHPSEILDYLNQQVKETLHQGEDSSVMDGMDLALCSYDTSTKKLEFAGANNPLYILRNNEIIETKGDKFPIGAYMDEVNHPFTNHEVQLEKDDHIYIFSDGYADQFGGVDGKKFKYNSFKKLLISFADTPIEEQKSQLEQTFDNWKGELDQVDDVCVIGIKI